jgi:hypothetical protein
MKRSDFQGEASHGRIDWKSESDRVDLARVATKLLGTAPGQSGERGRRLRWRCPFHEDRNPSFFVDPGKPWWRCYSCGEHGDAATLVMKLEGKTFPAAVAYLTGGHSAPTAGRHRPPPAPRAQHPPEVVARGLSLADALALVVEAEARL